MIPASVHPAIDVLFKVMEILILMTSMIYTLGFSSSTHYIETLEQGTCIGFQGKPLPWS
jgi:hypothetical protein